MKLTLESDDGSVQYSVETTQTLTVDGEPYAPDQAVSASDVDPGMIAEVVQSYPKQAIQLLLSAGLKMAAESQQTTDSTTSDGGS